MMRPLIIGGGPAGCAAALVLAKHGHAATIFERDRTTNDAICGGFMSWRTLAALETLGIVPHGQAIDRVMLFAGTRRAEARLPGRAIGLSRHALDHMMLTAAEKAGAAVERGVEAREIEGRSLRLADGTVVEPPCVFLAVGKHDLRGSARPREDVDPTLGLRLRLPAHPSLTALIGSAIELHLFDRGYAGLMLHEDGTANLCMAVRKSRLAEAGGRPEALFAALGNRTPLGDRLAFAGTAPVDAIAAVPYGWRALATETGVFRLGDQAAVIPSLAGEGIGIAVASGIAAAHAYARSGAAAATAHQARFAKRSRRPVAAARMLWTLAEQPRVARAALPFVNAIPSLAMLAARLTRIGD